MRRSAIFLVRAAALAAAALGIYWLCIEPHRAAVAEAAVERRTIVAEAVGRQLGAITARENLRDLDRIAFARRLAPTWYVLYGRNCSLMGRWREAIDVYTRGLRIDQRPEIYFDRGLARLRVGETGAAVADLAAAARFNPFLVEQLDGELRLRVAAAAGLE
jgi:tetratricopeptide (TPR) repeat protein